PKPIPQIKQSLIDACGRYIEYVGKQGDKIVEIRYKMARIYYTYNHFDKAAPAFDDIVKNHAESPVACYAANLALDIYNGQKDYQALKDASHAYLDNHRLACGEEDRRRFARIELQSSFHLIKTSLEDNKRYIAAANAYMQLYRDHPADELADDAIYNAAVNYDLGNRLDKANEVRRFLVDKLPGSPLVPETLYNMAQSYERIVDFEAAATYYEMFARRYPQDKRSKDAIYNTALYRATLGDFDAARLARRDFIKLYADDAEVPNLAFANCSSTEDEGLAEGQKRHREAAVKLQQEAHDCYLHYLRHHGRSNADLACHAQARRAVIMGRVHNEKGAEEVRAYLLRSWPKVKKVGVAKLPHCVEDVAQAQYQALERPFEAYLRMTISALDPTPRGKRSFDNSRKLKVAERDRLVAAYREVAALGVPKWALAALFHIGRLYVDSIDKFLAAPIPDKIPGYRLSAEDKKMLRQQLQTLASPIEAQAVEALGLCVRKANELGSYNVWSLRALDALQQLRPADYPLVVELHEKVETNEPPALQRNGLVIADGDELKPVRVHLTDAPAPKPVPVPVPMPVPAAPPAPAVQAPTDGVPAPVEE
ncbi:MAG: tetratricopeptide repeat protein, partial [Deltaproteobacteria bacterium]